MDKTTETKKVKAFYDKLRAQIVRESDQALARLDLAEAAAHKIFQKSVAPAPNEAAPKAPRVRGSRLDPEIQKAVLAAVSTHAGRTVKEIAKLSKAGPSQVRAALAIAEKAGTVAGDVNRRNRRYILTTEVAANG
jgi:hypothetical protein